VSRPGSAGLTGSRTTRVGLFVSVAQTAALGVAAGLTNSTALKAQTATSLADVAGGVFLLIGVISSARAADERHPLGYGRERFFWSFLAAMGIFVGGFGAAVAETIHAALHPEPAGLYVAGYVVLAITVVLDGVGLAVGLGPLLRRSTERHVSVTRLLWRGTDPASTTVVLTSTAGVVGGVLATAGLAGRQLTGRATADTVAGALIALVLLATSIVLLHTDRELLTGRGLPLSEVERMRGVVGQQPGVLAVPDIFAIVVGAGSLIVDGDVVFDDHLDVPAVETVIVDAATALRTIWPGIAYVYLNPVAMGRARRSDAPSRSGPRGRPCSALTGWRPWVEVASVTSGPPAGGHHRRRRWLPSWARYGALTLITVLVLEYLVLPQLLGAREAVRLLSQVTPQFLALGVALELCSLASYSMLTRCVLPPANRPSLWTVLRIDVTGLGVSHVLPGGAPPRRRCDTGCSPCRAQPRRTS
jgi:cation diffusion facilitator family transporter